MRCYEEGVADARSCYSHLKLLQLDRQTMRRMVELRAQAKAALDPAMHLLAPTVTQHVLRPADEVRMQAHGCAHGCMGTGTWCMGTGPGMWHPPTVRHHGRGMRPVPRLDHLCGHGSRCLVPCLPLVAPCFRAIAARHSLSRCARQCSTSSRTCRTSL